MLKFEQLTQLPSDSVVSVPVLLDTAGKNINALSVRSGNCITQFL
jgi:hypothetical protein